MKPFSNKSGVYIPLQHQSNQLQNIERWITRRKSGICSKSCTPFMIVTGPSGVGKRSAVRYVSEKLKSKIIEVNISDYCRGSKLQSLLKQFVYKRSDLLGDDSHSILVISGVDNNTIPGYGGSVIEGEEHFYDTFMRFHEAALVSNVKTAPVIIVCDEYRQKDLYTMVTKFSSVSFYSLRDSQMMKFINNHKLGACLEVTRKRKILQISRGDMNQALISMNRCIQDNRVLCGRDDSVGNMFRFREEILRSFFQSPLDTKWLFFTSKQLNPHDPDRANRLATLAFGNPIVSNMDKQGGNGATTWYTLHHSSIPDERKKTQLISRFDLEHWSHTLANKYPTFNSLTDVRQMQIMDGISDQLDCLLDIDI